MISIFRNPLHTLRSINDSRDTKQHVIELKKSLPEEGSKSFLLVLEKIHLDLDAENTLNDPLIPNCIGINRIILFEPAILNGGSS